MTESLSAEQIISHTETLKQRFLQDHGDDSGMDPRDIYKVRNDPHCVVRFVRHNRGNLDHAYNHMVECFKWRHSFGLNDIQWTDIDDSLWKSGMAWNRGLDKDGNNICILNIHLHRKDAKKAPMLQRWIAFSFEMHRKVYPTKKMCMIFDMSGAGLAQMDMDLVRFVVNSFKIYFPDMLAWLLVFNMPWVLQAAWKIVQSWLSEGAVAKVKFVTKDSIGEYIPADQRLVKFGGTDTWEFDYQVERDRMYKLAVEAVRNDGGGDNDDLFQDELEESGQQDRSRQVRFSSGLPPTRQSRFGFDDELDEQRSISPQQRLLQQGSNTTSGMRRRQVSRLMSLQDHKDHRQVGLQRAATVEERPEFASLNGGLRRHSAQQSKANGGVATIGDVMVSPSNELTFVGKKDSEITCTLTLTNTSDNSVLYKIKTTAPARYKVRPNVAMVDGKSVAKVQVMFTPGAGKTSVSQDKFLVQTYTFSADASLPDMGRLIEFWRALPEQDIREHRMHCRLLSDTPPKPVLKDTSAPKDSGAPAAPAPLDPLKSLQLKVANLTEANNDLKKSVDRLLILNYVIISMLVLVLVLIYLF